MQHSERIATIAEALAKAQNIIHTASKDSENPYYKSKYADLASVWNACRTALSTNGLAVIQGAETQGELISVTTLLAHSSGEWIESSLVVKPVPRKVKEKDGTVIGEMVDPQAVGSAITYARRYALASMVGVAPEDDDGNLASAVKEETREAFDCEKEIITFGKHKGQTWCFLPKNYLEWLSNGDNPSSKNKADATLEYLRMNPVDELFKEEKK